MKTTIDFKVTSVMAEERYPYEPDMASLSSAGSPHRKVATTTLVTLQGPEKVGQSVPDSITLRLPGLESPYKYGEFVRVTFETA